MPTHYWHGIVMAQFVEVLEHNGPVKLLVGLAEMVGNLSALTMRVFAWLCVFGDGSDGRSASVSALCEASCHLDPAAASSIPHGPKSNRATTVSAAIL